MMAAKKIVVVLLILFALGVKIFTHITILRGGKTWSEVKIGGCRQEKIQLRSRKNTKKFVR